MGALILFQFMLFIWSISGAIAVIVGIISIFNDIKKTKGNPEHTERKIVDGICITALLLLSFGLIKMALFFITGIKNIL